MFQGGSRVHPQDTQCVVLLVWYACNLLTKQHLGCNCSRSRTHDQRFQYLLQMWKLRCEAEENYDSRSSFMQTRASLPERALRREPCFLKSSLDIYGNHSNTQVLRSLSLMMLGLIDETRLHTFLNDDKEHICVWTKKYESNMRDAWKHNGCESATCES